MPLIKKPVWLMIESPRGHTTNMSHDAATTTHDAQKGHELTRVMRPMYARRQLLGPAPRHSIPEEGMPPSTAYRLIHDELIFDGSSRFNLATFCGTWMEHEARTLMSGTFDKNMIDKDEYPQTAELEMRCLHMLAHLWHSPDPANALGTSTIGSSEACMLGGLALKWRWREKMRKLGKPFDRPNMVLGTNTQVCWHKFLRYWDVEERAVPLEGERSVTDPERIAAACGAPGGANNRRCHTLNKRQFRDTPHRWKQRGRSHAERVRKDAAL